jgi:nitroimidazol reductase NimA-like FMN-containing flavoprotein (pyridoxamine 5'-phosphate oxidase superfamily)
MEAGSATRSFEVLSDEECLQLLAREPVGRIGLTASALPVVLPVNFVLDGSRVVFVTDPGLKLDAARAHDVACMEVDRYERWTHCGWSVLATGRLREIVDADEVEAVRQLPVRPWADLHARHWVELRIELLSGRRIGIAH